MCRPTSKTVHHLLQSVCLFLSLSLSLIHHLLLRKQFKCIYFNTCILLSCKINVSYRRKYHEHWVYQHCFTYWLSDTQTHKAHSQGGSSRGWEPTVVIHYKLRHHVLSQLAWVFEYVKANKKEIRKLIYNSLHYNYYYYYWVALFRTLERHFWLKAVLNRRVLSDFLNMGSKGGLRMAFWSDIRRVGAEMEKALSTQVLCLVHMGGTGG